MTTHPIPALEALADRLGHDLRGSLNARTTFMTALRDAYDLGAMSAPEPTPAPRTAFGKPTDPAKREGFVLQAVNTIEPEQIAEHGEVALLAWIQQTIRELAKNGANPLADLSLMVVGMPDGTVVVTGEASA